MAEESCANQARSSTDKKFNSNGSSALEASTSIKNGEIALEIQGATVVKKYIGPLTMIAIGFNICNSWAGVSGSMQIALIQGGPATLLYGMMITSTVYMSIALSMGELASVYPTAGGQYHFASILAPKSYNRSISYTCGIITMFSWIAIGAAVMMIPSTQIIALATYYNPEYVSQTWHYFLIYQSFGVVVLLYNIFALIKLPRTHDIGFVLTIVLFFATFITLLARSSPKADSKFVWGTFINATGWNDGVCFFTGLLTTCFIFAGLDAALHLAEEAPNPRTAVPRAGVLAVSIGVFTAFVYTISLLYSISDFEAVLGIQGYLPFEINKQAMGSEAAALAFLIGGIFLSFFILNAIFQTSSRITWAFARDNALVFSKQISVIHPRLEVPVYALIVNWALFLICGCIFLASSTAFNAILGSSVVLQQISFVIPICLLLYRRRSEEFLPKNRAFYLPGWLGWLVNIIVVVMASLFTVFFLLPPFLPVSGLNMNYTCVILFIAGLLGSVNWFLYGRNHYQGPRITFHN